MSDRGSGSGMLWTFGALGYIVFLVVVGGGLGFLAGLAQEEEEDFPAVASDTKPANSPKADVFSKGPAPSPRPAPDAGNGMMPPPPTPRGNKDDETRTTTPAPTPPPGTPPTGDNKNTILLQSRGQVQATSSSTWGSYRADRLVDGDPTSAWFSGTGDAASFGKEPWVEIRLPDASTVRHVTVLGNRDRTYPQGYFVLKGELTLADAQGKPLKQTTLTAEGTAHDFDAKFDPPVQGVQVIRFRSLEDEGDRNGSRCIALGEIQVE